VLVRGEIEAEALERLQADRDGPLLGVEGRQGRHSPQVRDVVRGWLVIAFFSQDSVSPALAKLAPACVLLPAGRV